MATSPESYDYEAISQAIRKYYLSSEATIGAGPYVHGTIFSRGRGLGSLIRTAIKAVTPFVKNVGKVIKPMAKKAGKYALTTGVETGLNIATDMLTGTDPSEALKYNLERSAENAKYDAVQELQSLKRRRLSTAKPKKGKRVNFK